jgi:hypothetical protein
MKNTVKASVTVFALLMLGLIIGMYLVGYQSPAVNLASQMVTGTNGDLNSSFNASGFIDAIGSAIISPLGLGSIAAILLFSSLASIINFGGGGGQTTGFIVGAAMQYFIPVLILFTVANIVFFPVIPEANAQGLPPPLGFIMTIIFNVLLMLTVISFVSQRD